MRIAPGVMTTIVSFENNFDIINFSMKVLLFFKEILAKNKIRDFNYGIYGIIKVPSTKLFPATGDNNRLYVDLHSKRIYYWDRGAYQIASPDIVEQGSNPISEAFSYGGIVATVALLPTEGIRIGDVYIVEQDEGHEQNSAYVWSGTQWIEIGGDMEHLVAICGLN